jgi:hypothetical protein
MKGFGTSEYVLLEIICTRTVAELAAIKETYERYTRLLLYALSRCWSKTPVCISPNVQPACSHVTWRKTS